MTLQLQKHWKERNNFKNIKNKSKAGQFSALLYSRQNMEIIKYFNSGRGLAIMITVLTIAFIVIAVLLRRSSKKNYTGRILFPVFFLFMSIGFLVYSSSLSGKLDDKVGPAVIPMLWLLGILILSIFLIIRTLLGYEDEDPKLGRICVVIAFLIGTIFYLFIMIYIGYYIATFLYISIAIYALSYKNLKIILTLSICWITLSYFAFYRLLYVPLPKGILIERIFG